MSAGRGRKKEGEARRALPAQAAFFQLIKMPSFHKQNDLAVTLDRDSGARHSLPRADTCEQYHHSAVLIMTLQIPERLL